MRVLYVIAGGLRSRKLPECALLLNASLFGNLETAPDNGPFRSLL